MSSCVGYYVAKDMKYFPTSLGGTADKYEFFTDFPYPDHYPLFDLYYTANLGYHLESIINQLKYYKNPEFIEFVLHHFATVTLISLSYFYWYHDIGVVVFFLHDVSDIVAPLCKAVVDLKFKIKYVTLPILLFSWFYFRLYVFLKVIVSSIFTK
jgi:hypothetical protein